MKTKMNETDNRKSEYGDCYGCVHHRTNDRLCRVSGQKLFDCIKNCPWRTYPWACFHPDYIKEKK